MVNLRTGTVGVYSKQLIDLTQNARVSQVLATGNRDIGWILSFEFEGNINYLLSSRSDKIRIIKTELTLFKIIKLLGCQATLTELEIKMESTATNMAALFAVAQLNLSAANFSSLNKDVVSLYTGAINEKCDIEVSLDDFIDAVKVVITDPALFSSNLNALCMNSSKNEVKQLSLLWNHLQGFGNVHAEYQSQTESILSNLNREHLQ